ncbi:MAG: SOS response-associated peptidase [Deltaproteobacteria bacterium]|nr:SOS response-associated peptidase [Deltaproteobacteria bacterium]
MCGRFTLTVRHLADVAAAVEAFLEPEHAALHRPRYNVAPTSQHFILRLEESRRLLVPASWGLVNRWAPDRTGAARQFNARCETVSVKPAYRAAFRSRRCAVPIDGFYEWRGPRGAREPVRFHARDERVLWLAGLYEDWTSPETGEVTLSFSVLTTEANAVVRPVHDRMPVLLDLDGLPTWLDVEARNDAALRALMVPAPDACLVMTPASCRVGSVRDDDPSLLEPDPERAPRQLGLFR